MYRLFTVLFIVGSFCLVSGQTDIAGNNSTTIANTTITNSTGSAPRPALLPYMMDCRLTPSNIKECSGNGVCGTDGKCRCYLSYFRVTNGDCAVNIRRAKDAEKFILVIRVFCGVAFGILLLLTSWRIFIEFRNRYSGDLAPVKNLTKFALGMLFLYCFFNFLGLLDYWGTYGVISHAGYLFIYAIPFPIAICLFSAIILHWVEVYNASTMALRREQMIQKINSNYTPAVSMEEILLKVTFLRKFRIFFAVIVGLSLAFLVAFMLVYFYAENPKTFTYYFNFWMAYFLLCWVCLGSGFVIYGIRMYKLMPDVVRPKIFTITVLAVFTVILLIIENSIIITVFNITNLWPTLITFYVLRFLQVACALNIYMPLWDWKSWFHTSAITSRDSKSGSGKNTRSDDTALASVAITPSTSANFSVYTPESV